MQPLLELGFGPDQDVLRETHSPQGSIAYFAILLSTRSVVGHHNHDVVIAIRTRIAARRRTEQVDPQRVYTSTRRRTCGAHRVVGRRRFEGLDLGFRHAHQSQFATGNGQKVGLLFSPHLHRNEQRRIALGHVHHVRVARGHTRIGVAEELLHGAQIAR